MITGYAFFLLMFFNCVELPIKYTVMGSSLPFDPDSGVCVCVCVYL